MSCVDIKASGFCECRLININWIRNELFPKLVCTGFRESKYGYSTQTPCMHLLHSYLRQLDRPTPCAKNETRVILNILYSCKSIAMKFSTWYPDGLRLAMKCVHNLPPHLSYVSTLSLHKNRKLNVCLPLNSVSGSEKKPVVCRCWSLVNGFVDDALRIRSQASMLQLVNVSFQFLPRDAMQARLVPSCGVRRCVRLSIIIIIIIIISLLHKSLEKTVIRM